MAIKGMATMIKFRAWDKVTSIYRKVLEIKFYPDGELKKVKVAGFQRKGAIIPEKLVIEQFTGLKDVNGKDIYEGDIIVSKPNDQIFEPLKIGVVKRSKIDAGWCYRIATDEYDIWTSGKYRTYEVIGNVHENPELLEK